MRFSSASYTLMLVVALVLTMSLSAFADEHNPVIGSVRTIIGSPNIVRGGDPQKASIGDHLFMGDTLLTTSKSSIGVIFRDDSVISLGPNSEIVIDEFVFEPAQKNVSFLSSLNKGTALFISGQIAKIEKEKILINTPNSTIGIRGTRFLVKVD